MKSLRFRMNARDSRSKKQSCNNVSNPRKQRQIHTCFTRWEKTRARNGSKHRSLKRDNDSMDLKTEDVGRRSPFWIGSHFPLPDFLIIPRSFTPLFLIPKATLNSRRNAWIWTDVGCPQTSLPVCAWRAFLPLIRVAEILAPWFVLENCFNRWNVTFQTDFSME